MGAAAYASVSADRSVHTVGCRWRRLR